MTAIGSHQSWAFVHMRWQMFLASLNEMFADRFRSRPASHVKHRSCTHTCNCGAASSATCQHALEIARIARPFHSRPLQSFAGATTLSELPSSLTPARGPAPCLACCSDSGLPDSTCPAAANSAPPVLPSRSALAVSVQTPWQTQEDVPRQFHTLSVQLAR